MSDILDRLRDRIHDSPMPAEHLMDEAAAEIKRLRAELMRVLDKAENSEAWWLDDYMDVKAIRAALEQNKTET